MIKRIIEFDIADTEEAKKRDARYKERMNDIRDRQKKGVATTEYENTELSMYYLVENKFESWGLQ